MKRLLTIIIAVVTIAFVLSFFKDMIVKTSVEKGVELVTGLQLKIQSFKVGVIHTLVGIRNLRLYNPKGYPDKVMLDMPEIYIDYDLPAIIKGKVHLSDMRIDMKEFVVVKNQKGELNLDSLKVVQAQKEGKKPAEATKGKAPEIQIDNLELKISKVVYKDYSKGKSPDVREFNINLSEKYKDIKDPYKLVSLIVVKALMNTTIANLTNFDLSGLQGTVVDTLATAQKVAIEAAAKAQETVTKTAETAQKAVQQTTQQTQKAVKETADTLKKTTDSLKDIFKSSFGSQEEK